ncbi:MAG: hypothetical protein ACLQOZ_03280 [Acidimicrobiales bacterium]
MDVTRRIRANKGGLVASLAAVAALGLTATLTLGGFSAGINNSSSTFSSATIQLEEGNGTTTCYSTGSGAGGTVTATNTNTTCSINALVGTLDQVPAGASLTTTLTFTNAGNHNATVASMVTGACTAAAASDANGYVGSDTAGFCGKVDVTVANTTTGATDKCVYPTQAAACPALSSANTLSGLASTTFNAVPLTTLAAGASATYVVTVQLDTTATNIDQGLTATEPFTWSISQ